MLTGPSRPISAVRLGTCSACASNSESGVLFVPPSRGNGLGSRGGPAVSAYASIWTSGSAATAASRHWNWRAAIGRRPPNYWD